MRRPQLASGGRLIVVALVAAAIIMSCDMHTWLYSDVVVIIVNNSPSTVESVELTDSSGALYPRPLSAEPGQSVELPSVPKGIYTAVVWVESGLYATYENLDLRETEIHRMVIE